MNGFTATLLADGGGVSAWAAPPLTLALWAGRFPLFMAFAFFFLAFFPWVLLLEDESSCGGCTGVRATCSCSESSVADKTVALASGATPPFFLARFFFFLLAASLPGTAAVAEEDLRPVARTVIDTVTSTPTRRAAM